MTMTISEHHWYQLILAEKINIGIGQSADDIFIGTGLYQL